MMTMFCVDVQEVYEVKKKKRRCCWEKGWCSPLLDFDITIHHSYKRLVVAIKKLQMATNTLAQVAWNFVNDGLASFYKKYLAFNHLI
jgi:hypothetical protein